MSDKRSYDLSPEMLDILAGECDPAKAVSNYAGAVTGAGPEERDRAALDILGGYGRHWASRTLELGEKYVERTYEIIKEAANKTGRLAFPHIPQRFMEIGYLATQPMEYLNIIVNNHYELTFSIEQCSTYDALEKVCGEALAAEMPCRHACLSFCSGVLEGLNMDADFSMEASRAIDGFCRFKAANRKA